MEPILLSDYRDGDALLNPQGGVVPGHWWRPYTRLCQLIDLGYTLARRVVDPS